MRSSALVEESEELCACTSGIKTVGRAMNRHQWEIWRGISGVYKDISEVSLSPPDMISSQLGFGENPSRLGIGGHDVEISKQGPSGADVEWIIR